jgi:hypothetical protein
VAESTQPLNEKELKAQAKEARKKELAAKKAARITKKTSMEGDGAQNTEACDLESEQATAGSAAENECEDEDKLDG